MGLLVRFGREAVEALPVIFFCLLRENLLASHGNRSFGGYGLILPGKPASNMAGNDTASKTAQASKGQTKAIVLVYINYLDLGILDLSGGAVLILFF